MLQPQSHRPVASRGFRVIVLAATLTACSPVTEDYDRAPADDDIVRAAVNAPVAPDGRVAGHTTDLVLNLDAPLDPGEPGLTLHDGDRIRVTLPKAFTRDGDLPLVNIFDCIPQHPQCDTVVPLLGWPQGALGAPPPVGYELSFKGSHTVVIAATQDHVPDPPANPGLKQIHLLLNSFTNPPPGQYPIRVEIATDDGVKRGTTQVRILPEIRPSIAVTNAFHGNFANGNYQRTSPDSMPALPFDLLLWNRRSAPLEGVTIDGNQLVRRNEVVGEVSIEAPMGATGQKAFTKDPSARVDAPVTGIPAGHLRAFFRTGSATGEYRATFALDGGNAVEMVVWAQ